MYAQHLAGLEPYLGSRGVDLETAAKWQLGCVVDPEPGHEDFTGRLCIPYLSPGGVLSLKFRCVLHDKCSEVGCIKYLGEAAEPDRLFGVWNLRKDVPVLAICEGEFDTVTCTSAGLPAVGIPGATKWRPWWTPLFEGYDEVVVLRDGDSAGRKMGENIAGRLANCRIVGMPEGHDVSSFVHENGGAALLERAGVG